EVDRLAAFLEANEDVCINHQPHGLASAGNSERMASMSWANAAASSPKDGRFRKNGINSSTVSVARGSAGIRRAMILWSRSKSTLTPSAWAFPPVLRSSFPLLRHSCCTCFPLSNRPYPIIEFTKGGSIVEAEVQ